MPTPDLLAQLINHRNSGAVERFHVMRSHRAQTVADHSHGVAVLIMLVDPECSAALLKAALTHDFHERDTGDMPSTAKWAYPALAKAMQAAEDSWNAEHRLEWELSSNEQQILKYCDYMELFVWSWEEVMLGNSYAYWPLNNIARVLQKFSMPNDRAEALHHALRAEIINSTGRNLA